MSQCGKKEKEIKKGKKYAAYFTCRPVQCPDLLGSRLKARQSAGTYTVLVTIHCTCVNGRSLRNAVVSFSKLVPKSLMRPTQNIEETGWPIRNNGVLCCLNLLG